MPKVSVIVPVYGVEKYIERCVRSLFEQTLDDIEYIFIDDCGTDRSIEILKNLITEYPQRKDQVVIHRMEYNSGQAKVREWGMRNAKGSFIIHCDSDDWVEKKAYEMMYMTAVQENADLVICDYLLSNGETHRVDNSFTEDYSTERDSLIKQILNWKVSCSTWSKLIKRSIIQQDFVYPVDNMCEDVVISMQYAIRSQKIVHIKEPLYYYFVNENSICNITDKNKLIEKARQICRNTDLTLLILRNSYGMAFESSEIMLKFRSLQSAKVLKNSEYRMYAHDFNWKILKSPQISNKQKISHILKLYGLYNIVNGFINEG